MGKQVDRWQADDGTEFQTKQEMDLYELKQSDAKLIDLFIRQGNYSTPYIKRYALVLSNFLTFVRENDIPLIPEYKVVTTFVEKNPEELFSAFDQGEDLEQFVAKGKSFGYLSDD